MSKANLYAENTGSEALIEAINTYAPLVKQIAYHLLSRLPPSVQLEDLIQAGMVGLIEAQQRFDPTKNVTFEVYASIRIRGTMIDELRKLSWMPRSTHQNMRKIAEAIRIVENRTGREAQSQEIVAEMGIGQEQYAEMCVSAYANDLFSLDDINEERIIDENSQVSEPDQEVNRDQTRQRIAEALKTLPQQEQIVLAFYYNEKLRFKEIGQVLGIGEARVCQIHSQGLARLGARLKHE